jgi:hypothetical protein
VIGNIAGSVGRSDLAREISIAHDGEFMYALRAVSDDALETFERTGRPGRKTGALQRERWYPIYGGGIDISKIIPPRASRGQYYIAIRRADDIFDTENGYATRITVPLKPRFNARNLNRFVEYDAFNERIVLSPDYPGGDLLNIIYRYD